MAKKLSTCSIDTIAAGVVVLPEAVQATVLPFIQKELASKLQVSGKELDNRAESVAIAAEEIGKRIQQLKAKPEKFDSYGITAATDKNSKMYNRNVGLEGLVSHHTMSKAYARIVGLVRGRNIDRKTGLPTSKTGESLVEEAVTRFTLADMVPRLIGIPLVTHKAVVQKGPMHYSFLGMGDIGRVFIATENKKLFASALLRSANGTQNIQFQNLSEASRRILEGVDTKTIEELQDDIRDALTNSIGKPVDPEQAKLVADAMAWTKTAQGTKVVSDLAKGMTDPAFIKALVKENDTLTAVTVALAKADGYKLAEDLLGSVADLTSLGARLQGYGEILLENGLVKIFGDDTLVTAMPDKLNLAFAQQAAALFFSHLDDTTVAALVQTSRNARAAAKQAAKKETTGKTTKTDLNKAKKENNNDISTASAKQAEDEVANDVNIRNSESSIEASSIARQYYLENYYGTIVGGLAKAISKVSNVATMGTELKTKLIGVEHLRLENSAIVTAELRKFADKYGQDIPKFNATFRLLQGTTEATRETTLAGMNAVDRQIADGMLYFIDNIYGLSDWNKLVQEGIHADEMIKSLNLVGQTKQAALFESRSITTADEAKDFWKGLELDETDNVIEILSKYHSAIQLSMIRPQLAESAVRHFGHQADGLTREQALKQGYKPIADEGGLSSFLGAADAPPLFHPEIVKRLSSLNQYLEYERGFGKGGMQKLVNLADPIVSVFKASNTIWRPGHHMTSIMGNTVSNMLAGVGPRYYDTALRVMKEYKMIDELDEGLLDEIAKTNIPDGYVFKGAEKGVKIALKDPKTGKIKEYTLDYAGIGKGATAVAGVRITPRRAKDVVDNELLQGTTRGKLMSNPASKGIASVDHQLARASAARDNVFRYALFIKELEKGGPYKSLEQAFEAAGSKVHEFHPTVGTLTAEERKYARRLFYFYTWQKQAFFKMMDLAANAPGVITMPSKLQFAIAESQGLNPESFGQPFDPTQLFAAYNTNTVYGPQWEGEYGLQGIKPAITQLDVIDSYLSKFQATPGAGLWENIGNNLNPFGTKGLGGIVGTNVSPVLKIPMELATGNKIGDLGKVDNIPQYLVDQTGFSSLSRISGQTPFGPRDDYKIGEYEDANRERQWINYLLGAKNTFYQSPSALETARQERIEYFKRINQNGETK
jgi:hypothetical protein